MSELDNLQLYNEIDKDGMYGLIFNFPEQIGKATVIGSEIDISRQDYLGVKNIVLAGMGGSAIGGDMAASYFRNTLKVPFAVCRNYQLPAYVDSDSLVIVSSYSGNTEEMLSAFTDAVTRKAKIICITTGGQLARQANKFKCQKITIPSRFQPRAALGFSMIPIFYILHKLGQVDFDESLFREVARGLKAYRGQYSRESSLDKNPAKMLAQKLRGKMPIIYSGPDLLDAVATRWKGQICENAEMLAFHNYFPEFNHNELVGFNVIDEYKKYITAVILRDSDDHDRVSKRMNIIKDLLEEKGIEVVTVYSQGDFPLGRMFSLIQLGDFASFYLAILNKVDPTPVKPIEALKRKMAEK